MSTKKPAVIQHFKNYVDLLPGNKGLTIDDKMPFEAWSDAVNAYGSIVADGCWALGDLYVFGEAHFGEAFAQALDPVKYKLKTVQDATQICTVFQPSRRRPALTFNHYKVVKSLGSKDLPAAEALLAEAEEKNMTTRQLADLLKEKHPKPPKKSKKPALDETAAQSSEDAPSEAAAPVTYTELLNHLDLAIAWAEQQPLDVKLEDEQIKSIKARHKALDRGLKRIKL